VTLDLWYTEKYDNKAGLALKVGKTLFHDVSEFQKIDVIETEAFGRALLLDGLMMTTEKDEFIYHEMITHVPLLSHPNPENILVIGGGDGGAVREILKHPCVKEVVLCEIDGKVIETSKKYLPSISIALDNPKVKILVRDGIEYISGQKEAFDIIIIDSTDPMGPGEGLFTEEFYTNVRLALKQGGIMAAQSESPIYNQREIKLIYSLLNKVFPKVHAYTAPIPTYPGGYWSWAFCYETINNFDSIGERRILEIEKATKYYNKEIHRACFALPNFVKAMVYAKDSAKC